MLEIEGLSYWYSRKQVLDGITLSFTHNHLAGILGPNGSGKSTLFKILSTWLYPQGGRVSIFGFDLATRADRIRPLLGVVFQSPSLDKKLTVFENLQNQGRLYGLCGQTLRERIDRVAEQLGISDRKSERIETLSGGLQRRVELAKGLLHTPKLLLLDEPTYGLDPTARKEFWNLVREIRANANATILFTTHLIEEAELCDQLAILDKGTVVANGTPTQLQDEIGKEVVTITTSVPEQLALEIRMKYKIHVTLVASELRLELDNGTEILTDILSKHNGQIDSISKTNSNLEDVYFHKTGKKFAATV